MKLATSSEQPAAVRQGAVVVLAQLRTAGYAETLSSLLADQEPAVRQAALGALVDMQDLRTLKSVLTGKGFSSDIQAQTVERLMSATGGALVLLRMLDAGSLSEDVTRRVVARAVDHPDSNVRVLFEKFVPPSDRPKRLGEAIRPEEIMALKGEAKRGEQIFFQSGKSRTVTVEVRRQRTYIKRDVLEEQALVAQEEVDRLREAEDAERRAVEEKVRRDVEQEEQQRREREESERRSAEENTRRAAEEQARREAEQKARETAEKERRQRDEKARKTVEDDKSTRYGRQELHIAGGISARHKKGRARPESRRRAVTVGGDRKRGFELPTQPMQHEVAGRRASQEESCPHGGPARAPFFWRLLSAARAGAGARAAAAPACRTAAG